MAACTIDPYGQYTLNIPYEGRGNSIVMDLSAHFFSNCKGKCGRNPLFPTGDRTKKEERILTMLTSLVIFSNIFCRQTVENCFACKLPRPTKDHNTKGPGSLL